MLPCLPAHHCGWYLREVRKRLAIDSRQVLDYGKELFRSPPVRDRKLRTLDVDVSGVRALELIVEDGGDGTHSDWGVWIAPRLVRP